jgi:DNA-binding IscR family transcriptional regulator
MSIALMALVWKNSNPRSPVDRLVLLSLADQANDQDGTCWPSIGHIAQRTGLSARTVQRSIRALEAAALLSVQIGGRCAISGARRASIYTVLRPGEGDTASPKGCQTVTHEGVTQSPKGCHTVTQRVTDSHPKGDTPPPQSSGIIIESSGNQGPTSSSSPSLAPITPEVIYAAFPRKFGADGALREIDRLLKHGESPECLLAAAQAYAAATADWPPAQRRFVKSAAVFFHDGHFRDDPREWEVGGEKIATDEGRREPNLVN